MIGETCQSAVMRFGNAAADPGADGHQRRVEDVPPVEVAIAVFSAAIVRVLIVVPRQFAAEIVSAEAVRPGIIHQPGEMIREAVLE